MDNQHTELVFSHPAPVTEDRVTVVINGHFAETDTEQTTDFRLSYNRVLPSGLSAVKSTIRVFPGTRVEIPVGQLDPENCQLFMAHEIPRQVMSAPADNPLRVASETNRIMLTNEQGDVLGWIPAKAGCVHHFPGKVFAESTSALALLSVTAFPA